MKWQAKGEDKLIAFLQGRLKDCSGKFLRKALDANSCRINGQIERFGSRRIKAGDVIELSPKWKDISKPKIVFATLYEDEFLKIVNKPSGWVCDPKNAEEVFGKNLFLAHRLDKETTGALILAKEGCVDALFKLFEERRVEKEYLALVDGVLRQESGEIRSFLSKKGAYQGQTIWGSGPKGLTAVTKWKRIAVRELTSFVSLEPETGRTHQIRVHMAEMGHPILIDRQYAKEFKSSLFCPRIMLHASRLGFTFKGKRIDVAAPLFPDMSQVLQEAGYPSS